MDLGLLRNLGTEARKHSWKETLRCSSHQKKKNGNSGATYLDEDFIGKAKAILRTTHPQTRSVVGIQHYIAHVSLRWLGGEVLFNLM